jgi:CRP-like cAMP-binding protein
MDVPALHFGPLRAVPARPQSRAVSADSLRALAEGTIFSGLDEAELDGLLSFAMRRRYKARDVVLRKGDPALQIFVIVQGRLKAITSGAEGRQATLSIMGPGEVFGEVAVLDGEPRSATITALEPCELMVLQRNDFLHFLERSPRVAVKLLEVLARRLRRLSERLEDVTFLEIPARLAKLLGRLAQRYGRDIGSGAVRVELKLSQQELGDLVGATRESVNKQLRAWVAEGMLEHQDGKVVLLEVERLSAVAEAGS